MRYKFEDNILVVKSVTSPLFLGSNINQFAEYKPGNFVVVLHNGDSYLFQQKVNKTSLILKSGLTRTYPAKDEVTPIHELLCLDFTDEYLL